MRALLLIPYSLVGALVLGAALVAAHAEPEAPCDPLPSWNDTPTKKALESFVARVTTRGSPDYVVPAERIAVFDNDGTLWAEKQFYFQAAFIVDRVKAFLALAAATHGGVTTEEFAAAAREWLATARHPKTGRLYTEMVYQPMLEVLAYLRATGFKTFIVSGGGIDFLRVFSEETYGVPPEQVVGTSLKATYEIRDGTPVIVKEPVLDFIDDKAGKPVAIHQHIGRRPIAAFGNSDGDFEMLEWTTSGPGARFGLLVHHDDADREWAYDRDSHVVKLARGLDVGPERGWTIASMKRDWRTVFPAPR